MKNKLRWIFIIFILLAILRIIYLLTLSDADFNTVYASKYEEKNFNNTLIGKNKEEIISLLGEPLSIYKHEFYNVILYTENKDSIRLHKFFDCICFENDPKNKKYRCFYFDSDWKVRKAKIVGYDEDQKTYIKNDKEAILKKFGKPDDEILWNCNKCETLVYSKLTSGMQAGKTEKINVRQLDLDSNKVVTKVIKIVAGMATNTSCD